MHNSTYIGLDFSEIPPAKAPSADTEAFEKFAKQFLELVHGAKILKTVGRGADREADLIAQVGDERWLVSCKHYRTRAVPKRELGDPGATIDEHGCDRFVGFFSGTPSDALAARLYGIERNRPGFKFYLWFDRDIAQQLLSHQNVNGWLLAARWFPKSYGRLFSRLAYPVKQITVTDVQVSDAEGTAQVRGMAFKMHFAPGNEHSRDGTIAAVVHNANEVVTSLAFDRLFLQRIAEFATIFPGAFIKKRFVADEELTTRSVFPSWDLGYLTNLLLQEHGQDYAVYNVCRVWSFWDAELAIRYARALRMLRSIDRHSLTKTHYTEAEITKLYSAEFGEDRIDLTYSDWAATILSIGGTSDWSRTENRGFFAALLCFCPGGLSASLPDTYGYIHLARHLGELPELEARMQSAASLLEGDNRTYVRSHGDAPLELLTSLRIIDKDRQFVPGIEVGLRCFVELPTEPWIPTDTPDPEVSRAFGLRPRTERTEASD
jgi:hypothetical protein